MKLKLKKLEVTTKKLAKASESVGKNQNIQALGAGMMATMPITLGVATFAVLGNLPIEGWQNFLVSSGLLDNMNDLISVTSNLLAIYIAFTIAFSYADNHKEKGLTSGVMSVATFLFLMPQTVEGIDGPIHAFAANYLSSDGIFVAIFVSLFISRLYCYLMSKNLKFNMPDTVPSMVSDSLSPIFVSMIIFTIVFIIRSLIGFTTFGNIFDLFNHTLSRVIISLGATTGAIITLYTLIAVAWFFGIHPSPIKSLYGPVILATQLANREAFLAGAQGYELPFLQFSLLVVIVQLGGTGGTLGLAFCMLRAKSKHFKSLNKISFVPNFLNINDPLIFGTPVMLNPLFFIPMVLSVPLVALIATFFYSIGAASSFNPTVLLPWVMPTFISALLTGGWRMMIMVVCCMVAQIALYYPFFKIADRKACLAEEIQLDEEVQAKEEPQSQKSKKLQHQ